VIPAAGLGTRAYPHTATIPKGLLEVDGKSVLQRNLELLRDQVGVREAVIVIGYKGEAIQETFGDGRELGIELRYVQNDDLDLGLAHSLRLAGRDEAVRTRGCVCVLSDEVYIGSSHSQLADWSLDGALAACGVLQTDQPRQIRRNYSVEIEGDHIRRIVEKPSVVPNGTLGTGTYVLAPELFERLEVRFQQPGPPPDWMGFLAELVRLDQPIRVIDLGGRYLNVNNRDELARANLLVRNEDFANKTVSVLVVVEQEDDTVPDVLQRFAKEEIHELVIIAREPSPELRRWLELPPSRLIEGEATDSFGDLLRRGLDQATGDIVVLAQSDDSFSPDDLPKLLTYAQDADMVVGTRTTRQMIEQGSNMRGVVRLAHIFLAKLIELLWWSREPRLTDAGCVYRAVWPSTWRLIRNEVRSHGQEVYPEMILEVLRARRRVIEIPVNYYNRDPTHDQVTSRHQTVATFLKILSLVLRRSFRHLLGRR